MFRIVSGVTSDDVGVIYDVVSHVGRRIGRVARTHGDKTSWYASPSVGSPLAAQSTEGVRSGFTTRRDACLWLVGVADGDALSQPCYVQLRALDVFLNPGMDTSTMYVSENVRAWTNTVGTATLTRVVTRLSTADDENGRPLQALALRDMAKQLMTEMLPRGW